VSPREDMLDAVRGDVDRSIPIELSAPARKRRSRAAGPIALGLVLLAGVALWSARGRLDAALRADPAPAATPTQVLLVTEQGSAAVEPGAALQPPAPTPVPAAPPASQPAEPGADVAAGESRPALASGARGVRGRASGSESRPRQNTFSATFARREGEIRRCFVGHTSDAAGGAEVSLRFEIGRDGRVGSAAVLPASVAATPLGACLTKIGKSTVFAPQPSPVTIRIPLTVQLQAGVGARP
jgi:hypothetical protein